MVTNWLNPSRMSNVLGAADPASLVQRNFDLITTAHSLTLPYPVIGAGIDPAPASVAAEVEANFAAIAFAMGIDLFPVADAADPEVCCQVNFELINAEW